MKNAGIAGGLVAIGLGLATIGLSNFSRNANAVPAAALPAGPDEPQIVWYGLDDRLYNGSGVNPTDGHLLYRAWSDGKVEMRSVDSNGGTFYGLDCAMTQSDVCVSPWVVVSSPTEGLTAAADINFDEIVDGADMGQLLAAWGDAPRSPIPASECPLGLMQ